MLKTEQHIQALLLKKQNPKEAAEKLLNQKNLLQKPEEFLNVCLFMYKAGLHKMLLDTAINQLKKKEPAPWAALIAVLNDHKIQTLQQQKHLFFKGICQQKQIPNTLTSTFWDLDSKWTEHKTKAIDSIYRKNNKTFIQLMKDLEFIESQKILEKEEEIIKKLMKLAPDHLEVQKKFLLFQEKNKHKLVKKRKPTQAKSLKILKDSPQEQKSAEKLLKAAQKIIKKTPKAVYDLALMLYFMDQPLLAARLLENHIEKDSAKWLYADLLLQSRRYLNCLNFLDHLNTQAPTAPETIFALTYMRAKAYYGAGEKNKAKEILAHLLKVQPHYRLARYLLEQWQKEEGV